MKFVLDIRKSLRIINLVLLIIFVYIVVSFICLCKNAGHSTVLESTYKSREGENILNKESSILNNHKIILGRNIFSPEETNKAWENPQRERVPAPFVRDLRLLATVAGDEEVACAVIENIKTKIQELYKTGDIIEGSQVERIERNRIILVNMGLREVLNLNLTGGISELAQISAEPFIAQEPSFTEVVNLISPTEREINKKAFCAKIGGMEAILKTVDVAPYVKNGKEDGLQITGLEDLSMAKYVGFENGDVIQVINGQAVTNMQKAFQILKKARVQPSLDIQLLRNQEKQQISFGIR